MAGITRVNAKPTVVVTGIGVISPFGIGSAPLRQAWLQHRRALRPQLWPTAPEIGPVMCAPLTPFDFRAIVQGLRSPPPMRYSQLVLASVALAISNVNLSADSANPFNVATIVATEFGAIEAVEAYMSRLILEGAESASPLLFSRTVANVALGDVARWLGARGPSALVLGENPIGEAFDLLHEGEAQVAVVAAVDELRLIVPVYHDLGLLWTHDTEVATSRDRVAVGEAAVAMVLETSEHASRAGHHPLAKVVSYAEWGDPQANFTLTGRRAGGIQTTMKRALERACVEPKSVTHIIGAANSARCLAEAEDEALNAVFGESHALRLSRPKEIIGETFASSALVGLSLATLQIAESVGQSSAVIEPKQPYLCNSFALGGGITSVVICEATK